MTDKDKDVIDHLGLYCEAATRAYPWYERYNPFWLRKELKRISGMANAYLENEAKKEGVQQ